MLGIGWFEIFVIAAGALIVVGPKDFPALLRNAGRFLAAARRSMDQIRSEFDQAIQAQEVESLRKSITEPLQDLKRDLNKAPSISGANPKAEAKTSPTDMNKGDGDEPDVYDDIVAVTRADGDDLAKKAAELESRTFKPDLDADSHKSQTTSETVTHKMSTSSRTEIMAEKSVITDTKAEPSDKDTPGAS